MLLDGLNQPFGMLVLKGSFYVANTDGILQFPWKEGQTRIDTKGKTILQLPAGGYNNHWTRNLIANSAGTKIYVTVGSARTSQNMESPKNPAAPTYSRSTLMVQASVSTRLGYVIPTEWTGSPARTCFGQRSTNETTSVTIWSRTM